MNLRNLGKKIRNIFSFRDRYTEQVQRRYAQWYETDKERLKWEIGLMQTRYPQLSIIKLNDGRIAFRGFLNGATIAVIFPYLYPVEPPQIAIFVESKQGDPSGNLTKRFIWQTDMSAANALQQAQNSLRVNEGLHGSVR